MMTTTDKNYANASEYYQQAQQAYDAGQFEEACRLVQASIAIKHVDVTLRHAALNLLAITFSLTQQLDKAISVWRELEKDLPNDVTILSNIGMALTDLERYDEAIQYLLRATQTAPSYATAHLNLSVAYFQNGDMAKARASNEQALIHDPTCMDARFNLAKILEDERRFEDAVQAYWDIFALDPAYTKAMMGMLHIQSYVYPADPYRQMECLHRYVQQFEIHHQSSKSTVQLKAHQPLRIGFVSADFRQHPVGFFLEGVLEQIGVDPALSRQVRLIGYYNRSQQDDLTRRLRRSFDEWRQVDGWSDDRLAEQIRSDNIDILIDLSGYTEGYRLPVFVKKPAPLQVSWLGYWGSTGLSSIDYVLADPISVPANEEHWFVEKLWKLPHLRYCFSIPEYAPKVSPPPCVKQPQLVFGCYQRLSKISQGVLNCWAQILVACPQARFRIQSKELDNPDTKKRLLAQLTKAGIDIRQVNLFGSMNRSAYLASYSEVDVLFDTFPFTGGTTTAESLWMGVPTITLALPGMLGRQGEAFMVNAGLTDWIVRSEDEYVQKAIDWAHSDTEQRQQLATLRMGMREQVAQSPIFNAKQFAQDFVGAMYGMWDAKSKEQAELSLLDSGADLIAAGKTDEAFQTYQQVIALNANPAHVAIAFSNMFALNSSQYPLDADRQRQILESYRQHYESQTDLKTAKSQVKPMRHTPLRVGFVSGDFRFHPVSRLLESTLTQFRTNPKFINQVEIFAYSNNRFQDEYTLRLKSKFDVWCDVRDWSDEHLAEQISRDKIDILIDLSGHTQGHRLPVFAKKVAPLQVSWMGAWGSTGLSSIDYVLTDSISVPESEESGFAEQLWKLPHASYSFTIPEDAPEVNELPCLQRTEVVLASYISMHQLNVGVLSCWLQIMSASPNARLRLQIPELDDQDAKEKFVTFLDRNGFDLSRIDLIGATSRKDYLASFAEVDILLDTFPQTSGVVTAEALWMGVPTISLAVPGMLGRQGQSLLTNAGLAGWVAHTEEEYVHEAIAWANADESYRQALAKFRQGLREKVRKSPLVNTEQFASEFVDALHGMWQAKYGE